MKRGNNITSALALLVLAIATVGADFGNAEDSPNTARHAIASFPKLHAWYYRPDLAAKSANVLITMGEEQGYNALRTAASEKVGISERFATDEKICCLCRLLYQPTNSSARLRPPELGAPHGIPYKSMTPLGWPEFPLVVVDNIPLSFNLGYSIAGVSERASSYLAYCKANGRYRTNVFAVPTSQTVSNALGSVFASERWKNLKWKDTEERYDIDEQDTMQSLWQQARNVKE